ncbi:hypothetical protein BaRGS_00012541 [Batillaria attramentaria]|uniref:Uncharacterized protein n=1 Tax=Batillaria attramentaria TaxID=370345 RepID=A0ABD0LA23_9CAEN
MSICLDLLRPAINIQYIRSQARPSGIADHNQYHDYDLSTSFNVQEGAPVKEMAMGKVEANTGAIKRKERTMTMADTECTCLGTLKHEHEPVCPLGIYRTQDKYEVDRNSGVAQRRSAWPIHKVQLSTKIHIL